MVTITEWSLEEKSLTTGTEDRETGHVVHKCRLFITQLPPTLTVLHLNNSERGHPENGMGRGIM